MTAAMTSSQPRNASKATRIGSPISAGTRLHGAPTVDCRAWEEANADQTETLSLWEEGEIAELLKEGRAIQRSSAKFNSPQ